MKSPRKSERRSVGSFNPWGLGSYDLAMLSGNASVLGYSLGVRVGICGGKSK
jgi:hypothetical protein